jgi:GNAT superfamily N-acetyltransferase
VPIADDIAYRLATFDDLPAEHAVFCRAEGGVLQARQYEWADPPFERFSLGLRHLLAHDPARCWVAELDGRLVAYTGALVRNDTWFFSMLFIDPEAQGRGIGRRLFDLAVDGAPERRLTITDSIQPVSNALYGRKGLLPIAPLIRLSGPAPEGGQAPLELGEATSEQLGPIDWIAYGFDRRVDHDYWASRWERRAWFRGGELVAWAYRWPDGNIGPLAAIDPATAADAFRSELAAGGPISVEMPATARPLLAAALDAGLRIKPPMALLLAADGVSPPSSLAISTYGFF